MLTEGKLKELGFERYTWEDEGHEYTDHKLQTERIAIEITNLETVELTTRGQYVKLDAVTDDDKLEQLINLLTK